MRKTLMLVFFISISLGLKISAQISTEKKSYTTSQSDSKVVNQSQIPADFPTYVNTGNATQDAINFDNAKKEWIKNNPEKYKEMNGDVFSETGDEPKTKNSNFQYSEWENHPSEKKFIDKKTFETLSPERKDYILAHPEKYSIVETIQSFK